MSAKLDLERASDCRSLAEAFKAGRDELAARAYGTGGVALMRLYSDLTDSLLSRIARISGLVTADAETECSATAMVAVGGYGRQEVAPFSDVDVAFVVANGESRDADAAIKRAHRTLNEVLESAGVKVGYSYRRIDEVEGLDLETLTALLDSRCIVGSRRTFREFQSALTATVVPAAFVAAHIERRKHAKPDDTVFAVEPDIKDGPGGLRDLHAARWIARVAFDLSSVEVWRGLHRIGILRNADIESVCEASGFLSRVRNALHLSAGRCTDALTVGRQESVARDLGLASQGEMMACYYKHALAIRNTYRRVADAGLQERLAIEPGVVVADGRLLVSECDLLARDAATAIRILRHAEVHGACIPGETRDILARVSHSENPASEVHRAFLEAISDRGAAAILRSMAELGLLGLVVPHFDDLMFLVPGDSVHKFTVGEHSLRTVEELGALADDPRDQIIEALSRVPDYGVLVIAALTHDVGKLDSTGDHSSSGASRASRIASSLGLSEEKVSDVEFLVRNHLKMSGTARLRDLSRRQTIREFADLVGNVRRLDMLFLLTAADCRAVGTQNWNQVHNRFLLELYERTRAVLRQPESAGANLDRHRRRVRRELSVSRLPLHEVDEHCESMSASYLLNTSPEELAAHIGYIREVRKGQPVVELKDNRADGFTQLTVLAPDKPGLLSDITGTLYALGVDIHAAQVYTRNSKDSIALDVLYVDLEGHPLSETAKCSTEAELVGVVSGSVCLAELLNSRSKRPFKPRGRVEVRVLGEASERETVLDVRASDFPGLLYHVTRVISRTGLNIHSARVSTWGREARDVFYVTSGNGGPLSIDETEKIERELNAPSS